MPRPKKLKEEPEKRSELNLVLSDIRREIKLIPSLIKLLEGVTIKFDDQHEDFCKAYTILLFQKYIKDEDNREMMLAACGLLDGYEFKEQELDKRLTDYRKYAQGHNPWIKSTWVASTYTTKCRGKLAEIVTKLETTLMEEKAKNGGILGIIDEVPDKLTYPKPRYISDESEEKSENGTTPKFEDEIGDEVGTENEAKTEDETIDDIIDDIDDPKSIRLWIKRIVIVLSFFAVVAIIAFLIWKWHEKSSLDDQDTGAKTIEELPKYEPQNRIVNLDEPDDYDVEGMFDFVIKVIINNPIYGDMMARGLSELDNIITDQNPWLTEFIEKTDAAMEFSPNQQSRGMGYWLEYRKGEHNNLFVTDDYFFYAAHICSLLEKFTILGVREWECSECWEVPYVFDGADCRAEKNTEKTVHRALILEYISKKTGKARFVIGISTEDAHLSIYDPAIVE